MHLLKGSHNLKSENRWLTCFLWASINLLCHQSWVYYSFWLIHDRSKGRKCMFFHIDGGNYENTVCLWWISMWWPHNPVLTCTPSKRCSSKTFTRFMFLTGISTWSIFTVSIWVYVPPRLSSLHLHCRQLHNVNWALTTTIMLCNGELKFGSVGKL